MRFFDQDFTCNIKDVLLTSEYESIADVRNKMNAELVKPSNDLFTRINPVNPINDVDPNGNIAIALNTV